MAKTLGFFYASILIVILSVLFIFFPTIISIIYSVISIFSFFYFKMTGGLIAKNTIENHKEISREECRLVNMFPYYYGAFFAQILFFGIIKTLQFASILFALGLIIKGMYFYLPLGVLAYILFGLSMKTFNPRETLLYMYNKANNEEDRNTAKKLKEISDNLFYILNRESNTTK